MRSLLEVVHLSTKFLADKEIKNARREAQDLIADAMHLSRMQLYMDHDRPLTEQELTMLRERVVRRGKGEPAAYIHGKVTFLESVFQVSPDVLIPRQETEILTDKILKALEKEDLTGKTLWDLCCGSGCIGISIKKRLPALTVTLSDISSSALAIAKANAEQNEVDVSFAEGDLLAPFYGQKAHYLVCNPPYVAKKEMEELDREVREHEPHLALLGGESGLVFYQRLAQDLPSFLHPGGKAWLEIGADQGKSVMDLFQGPPWKSRIVETDWAGKDRFFFLEIE
jgi:release factor glutamine methyltransferase